MENQPITRAQVKAQAKAALHDNYGSKMLLLIIPILYSIFSFGDAAHTQFSNHANSMDQVSGGALAAIAIAALVGAAIGIVIGIFIYIIEAGAIFNYIKIFRQERENPQFKNIFTPFKDGSWIKILLVYIVEIILLTLMIITVIGIPFAIYFGLGWSQSLYVLYDQLENGTYQGTMRVLSGSSELMRGKRGNYFVLQLSFLGWYILTGITGGLLGFWTMPYINMTMISYYENVVLA